MNELFNTELYELGVLRIIRGAVSKVFKALFKRFHPSCLRTLVEIRRHRYHYQTSTCLSIIRTRKKVVSELFLLKLPVKTSEGIGWRHSL